MFEDATFESQNTIHTRSRNWMLATLLLNSTILLVVILIPLLNPASLPRQFHDILIAPPPAPQQAAPQAAIHAQTQQSSSPQPIEAPINNTQRRIRIDAASANAAGPPADASSCFGCTAIGSTNGIPGGDPLRGIAPNPVPHVVSPSGPVAISKGVAEGMLIRKVVPVYSAIARAAHMEGTVVLQATISKSGVIEGLRVLSGPPLLRQAALDAVQQWRYRPYLLNGEPVEVETTINVVFTMGR
jgi:periplasmic protein TonB